MDQVKRAQMLGNEAIPKVLLKLSIPAILGMMVSSIYNIVDTLFVSKLGTEALGGVTIVMPFFMLISAIGMMFGAGAASYISRLLGQKNIQKANQTAVVALLTSVTCAVLFSLIGIANLDRLLKLFGASNTMLPFAREYARVIIAGSVFTMSNMTLNNMLRAEGSAKISMLGIMIGAVLNIALDPIFIFTLGMGVKGAAIATVISQALSTIVLLGYYLLKKSFLELNIKNFIISKDIYAEILKIGVPTLLRQGLASISMGMINAVAVQYGDSAVAAIGITGRIFMMVFYVIFGFSQGFQPLAGYNYGAKEYERVRETIRVSLSWTTIYSILVTFLMALGAPALVHIFTTDAEVLAIGTRTLRYFCYIFPTAGFLVIYNSVFMAFGHAKEAAVLSMARQGLFLIPAILILPKLWGLEGVLLSQPVANGLSVVLTAIMAIRIQRELKELQAQKDDKKLVAD